MFSKKKIIFLLIIIMIVNIIRTVSPEKFITNLFEKNTQIKLKIKDNRKYQQMNNTDIIVHNQKIFSKIAANGELGFAESYIDGDWDSNDLEKTIYELSLKSESLKNQIKKQSINLIFMEIKRMIKNNMDNLIKKSKKNISHHYDIGNKLFEKMLGKHMQYTCAYFHKQNMTLDEAQYAKMELIAKKLNLKPNMKILDIGCGFGSLAHHLAKKYNVYVIGVTLSEKQKSYADKYLSHPKVTIELKDYRHVIGQFDRVYSVGMFEHVGRVNYQEYYDKCYKLLKPDGIMLIHTIGTYCINGNGQSNFSNKYIFPGGQLPNLMNLNSEKINQKWKLEDFQNFGKSYTKTLRYWHKNIGKWDGLDEYNITFRRMWKFYLLGFSAKFDLGVLGLWHFVYTKRENKRNDDCHHIRN
jgi:cyclopropane-fatty-acyl-phospholipid synthase